MRKQCVFNWSGGKDSTLALHYALQDPTLEIKYLLTTVNQVYDRVSIHGVRTSLLVKQAESIGIPLIQVSLPEFSNMEEYNAIMLAQLLNLKAQGITHGIFGDIFLEDLKKYREDKLSEVGMDAIFPLWKKDTTFLIQDFIAKGYRTIVVCTKEQLGEFCGREIDADFITDLPDGVDPCGENGGFHTFAFKGPIFNQDVGFISGEKIQRTFPNVDKSQPPIIYWYLDLIDEI